MLGLLSSGFVQTLLRTNCILHLPLYWGSRTKTNWSTIVLGYLSVIIIIEAFLTVSIKVYMLVECKWWNKSCRKSSSRINNRGDELIQFGYYSSICSWWNYGIEIPFLVSRHIVCCILVVSVHIKSVSHQWESLFVSFCLTPVSWVVQVLASLRLREHHGTNTKNHHSLESFTYHTDHNIDRGRITEVRDRNKVHLRNTINSIVTAFKTKARRTMNRFEEEAPVMDSLVRQTERGE